MAMQYSTDTYTETIAKDVAGKYDYRRLFSCLLFCLLLQSHGRCVAHADRKYPGKIKERE